MVLFGYSWWVRWRHWRVRRCQSGCLCRGSLSCARMRTSMCGRSARPTSATCVQLSGCATQRSTWWVDSGTKGSTSSLRARNEQREGEVQSHWLHCQVWVSVWKFTGQGNILLPPPPRFPSHILVHPFASLCQHVGNLCSSDHLHVS